MPIFSGSSISEFHPDCFCHVPKRGLIPNLISFSWCWAAFPSSQTHGSSICFHFTDEQLNYHPSELFLSLLIWSHSISISYHIQTWIIRSETTFRESSFGASQLHHHHHHHRSVPILYMDGRMSSSDKTEKPMSVARVCEYKFMRLWAERRRRRQLRPEWLRPSHGGASRREVLDTDSPCQVTPGPAEQECVKKPTDRHRKGEQQ